MLTPMTAKPGTRRAQELRKVRDALQQHHHAGDGRQGDDVAGEHRGGEHEPGGGRTAALPSPNSKTMRLAVATPAK